MRLICGLWNLDGNPADAEMLAAMARTMIADACFRESRPGATGPRSRRDRLFARQRAGLSPAQWKGRPCARRGYTTRRPMR